MWPRAPPNAHDLRMRQLPCQYAYGINPITTVPLRLQPEQPIVPMYLQSTDQPIDELYIQPLSPPDACTVLLPESNNCRACTPAIPIMVVPISLRPKHDQVELYSLKYNPIAGTVLLVLEYMDGGYVVNRVYISVVLRTKKELPVSEYKDRSYVVTCRRRVSD